VIALIPSIMDSSPILLPSAVGVATQYDEHGEGGGLHDDTQEPCHPRPLEEVTVVLLTFETDKPSRRATGPCRLAVDCMATTMAISLSSRRQVKKSMTASEGCSAQSVIGGDEDGKTHFH
jgi:hypothetical protein